MCPDQGRSKFDDRSVNRVFIGYDGNLKGYKLYNSSNGKIIVCCELSLMKKMLGIWKFSSFHIMKREIKRTWHQLTNPYTIIEISNVTKL